MSRMVCTKCQTFLHPKKTGVWVEEGMPRGDVWEPYKIWRADAWECRACGVEIIAGFAPVPASEHFMPGYNSFKEKIDIRVFVKDCL